MELNQQIIVHSTAGITEYPSAKEFIESLSGHLKIKSTLPSGMTMISTGQTAPDEKYQNAPWLELDESGNPIALKFFNGAEWVDIVPYKAVKSIMDHQYIQRGPYTLDVRQANRQTWVHSLDLFTVGGVQSEFKFQVPFKAGTAPTVTIIPKKSSVHENGDTGTDQMSNDDLTDDIEAFDWCLGTVTNVGFTIWTKSRQAIEAGSEKAFSFDFTAIGEMEE